VGTEEEAVTKRVGTASKIVVDEKVVTVRKIILDGYQPPQYGVDTGREFNPNGETHHFGFIVKVVDPGCTLEVQIEEVSGQVTRITTTDNPTADREAIREAIGQAVNRFLGQYLLG
jgi:hypothetical protein